MIIKIRRGLKANLNTIVPLAGELVVTTDTNEVYIGDGTTAGGLSISGTLEQFLLDNYYDKTASDLRFINVDQLGAASGVATLDAGGKVLTTQIPALAITSTTVVADEAEQLALVVQEGDVAIRTDINESYINNGGTAGDMTDWTKILTPIDSVLSVNGYTGTVVLDTDDINEGSTNLYYTDARVTAVIEATNIGALADVDGTTVAANDDVLARDTVSGKYVPKSIADLASGLLFTDISDTPASYTGSGGFALVVNGTEDGVEFVDTLDAGTF